MRSVALRTRVVSVVVLLTFQARPRSSSVYDGQNLVLAALPYSLPTWRTPALAVTVGAIAYEAHRLATCCGTSWGTLPARETPPCTKFSYRARVSARLPCNCHCGVGRMPADSSMPLDDCSPTSTARVGGGWVLRGDVLAADFKGCHRGAALAVPEVELAAHLDLAARGQFAVVAHVGKRGRGQRARGWVGRVGGLRIQVGAGRNVPHHAQAASGGAVAAAEGGGRGGCDGAAVHQVEIDALVPQRADEVHAGGHQGAVFQVQRGVGDLVVLVRVQDG